MIRHALLACACLAPMVAPTIAQAQLGATVGLKRVNGQETALANADRHGVELRVHFDGQLTTRVGWRAELAGVQMQYQRDIPGLDRRQVSENGVEVPLLLTVAPSVDRSGRLTIVGGAAPSWRLNCGASGGFVACDQTPSARVGVIVGLDFATPMAGRREFVLDVRHSSGVVAGAGASVLTIGVGVRTRRPVSDR